MIRSATFLSAPSSVGPMASLVCLSTGVRPRSSLSAAGRRTHHRVASSSTLIGSRRHVATRAAGSVIAAAAEKLEQLSDEDRAAWESCKSLVMDLGLDEEAADKCMVKAFGWGAQNYWRQSKVEEVPNLEDVEARIAYLVEIGIPEDQIGEKILSKVSEVLGCDMELLTSNVAHIEKNYFMKRKTKNFANYIMRVPQALGNNVDCVSDGGNCAGECNRCWARC